MPGSVWTALITPLIHMAALWVKLLLFLHVKKTSTGKSSDLPKILKLLSCRAESQIQPGSLQSLCAHWPISALQEAGVEDLLGRNFIPWGEFALKTRGWGWMWPNAHLRFHLGSLAWLQPPPPPASLLNSPPACDACNYFKRGENI